MKLLLQFLNVHEQKKKKEENEKYQRLMREKAQLLYEKEAAKKERDSRELNEQEVKKRYSADNLRKLLDNLQSAMTKYGELNRDKAVDELAVKQMRDDLARGEMTMSEMVRASTLVEMSHRSMESRFKKDFDQKMDEQNGIVKEKLPIRIDHMTKPVRKVREYDQAISASGLTTDEIRYGFIHPPPPKGSFLSSFNVEERHFQATDWLNAMVSSVRRMGPGCVLPFHKDGKTFTLPD